ncbi:MAG: hypothetical protein OEX18_05320 [Candidatus Krumholzibacteria bacterium]|nr:hypothetical protein [Candidatus Krumholzibacteria bacterium]MDH4336681.1 hypothetical protein [Candidatus Krumholzibacteria bacterium]
MSTRWKDALLPVLLLVAMMLPLRHGFTDDGFIHIQYARNIMTRGEYAFNPGEVSFGTTSPLWVMALAVAGKVAAGPDGLVGASRFFSWLAALATLLVVHRALLVLGASRLAALCGTLAFAADAWFVRWSALGMESSAAAWAAALMVLMSFDAYSGPTRAARFAAAAAVGALIRPEMYLAFPVFVLAALTLRPRPRLRTLLVAAAVAAALLLPWLLFAKWHIGSFLPNTAGAKSGGMVRDPVTFIRNFSPVVKVIASTQAVALLALLVDLVVSRRAAVALSRELRFTMLWVIALPLAYVVADIQILSRYLLLIAPAICVVGWRAAGSLAERLAPRRAALAMGSAALLAVAGNAAFYTRVVLPPSIAFSEDLQSNMVGLARYLHDNSMPDVVVAAADIGYLAYYSERRVLDLGGLVEPKTAQLRESYDYEEIIERGLYFGVPGYPRVDYLVDRDHQPDRFTNRIVNGHTFTPVYATVVRNLGIRKPGEFHYTLYRVMPAVGEGP